METITRIQNMFSEKMTDFMDKKPGLLPSMVTLVIILGANWLIK